MNRIDGPTPNGGDYAVMYYYDAEGNSVDVEKAVSAMGCEFTSDGKLINETYFTTIKNEQVDKKKKSEISFTDNLEDTIELPIIK